MSFWMWRWAIGITLEEESRLWSLHSTGEDVHLILHAIMSSSVRLLSRMARTDPFHWLLDLSGWGCTLAMLHIVRGRTLPSLTSVLGPDRRLKTWDQSCFLFPWNWCIFFLSHDMNSIFPYQNHYTQIASIQSSIYSYLFSSTVPVQSPPRCWQITQKRSLLSTAFFLLWRY